MRGGGGGGGFMSAIPAEQNVCLKAELKLMDSPKYGGSPGV